MADGQPQSQSQPGKGPKRDDKKPATGAAAHQHQHQPAARKISSFQITSVTVGSRAAQDAGEDSADDLDESHTDDISRVTDLENETPSFSEDTFSKDDVFYNASSASLGCAPVIPTSAQYGLAIVGQEAPQSSALDQRHDHKIDHKHSAGDVKDAMHEQVRNERFKVVKIESTEPFRRGRWTCMDYLDHTTAPAVVNNVDHQPDSGISIPNDIQHVNEEPQSAPKEQQGASPGQSLAVQPPPVEMPQQQQQQPPPQQPQTVSHVPPQHPQQTQPPPVQQQIAQSFPSHQLQQAIAQGLPQMQQMQIHQQIQNQQAQMQSQQAQMQSQQAQLQNQQAQMQQLQGQQHLTQMPSVPQMQQMPQMQNQMQQIPQHIQMQQVAPQQPMHQMHPQQPQMQPMPHSLPPQQTQMQHMQPQSFQPAPTHQMPTHMQQIQQMPQMNGQMHPQPQMHPQVSQQQPQVQQPHVQMHQQMQQAYGGQPVPQPTNQQTMMQPTMNMAQQTQPLVQAQHVPQFYQGQSLTQEAMANIVNSQSLPNGMQGTQGTTLPSNLQAMNAPMHPMNQAPQPMQMMSQPTQNVPMSMDGNQVSDPMYMNQQMPMAQHMTAQQPMMTQVPSSQSQGAHVPQPGQMTMTHVMPPQSVPSQNGMPNMVQQNQVTMSNVQQPQTINQVPMSNVQQAPQPMMQSMVPQNQAVNVAMSMQPNLTPSVHSVQSNVVQTQASMHNQVNPIPMGGFAPQVVNSMQQNAMPAMSQPSMTTQMSMQSQMDAHMQQQQQQNIITTAAVSQPIMSGTNSPVVTLPVSSAMTYVQNPANVNAAENQNFGSPVSAVVSHVANALSNSNVGLPSGEVSNDSGGGTPASEGTQGDDSKDEQSGQNDDSESLSGLAMALGGSSNAPAGPPSRASSPHHVDTHAAPHHSASGTSAVAIDNKIEQAMDLVKSHLMFAVREEVEVLKERIAELMDKISQLEMENSILRASATQETLAQLSAPPPAASPPAGPVS